MKFFTKSNKRLSSFPAPTEMAHDVPLPNENLIELRNVIKRYETPGGAYVALKNATLTVKAGEFNVILPMEFARRFTPTERRARAMELLELVGVANLANKYPTAISGGQQQRVAIARALANDPPVLVADEPTGNLDAKTADAVFGIFEKFAAQGRTILMVTHDNDLASRASRVVLLADGEIAEEVMEYALPSLNQKQLVKLSANLEPVRYPAGQVIFKQGDPSDKFYIIMDGQVQVVLEHPGGQEMVSGTMGARSIFRRDWSAEQQTARGDDSGYL